MYSVQLSYINIHIIVYSLVTFSGFLIVSADLNETFVERQVVTYTVLPSLLVLPVERKLLHDELVNTCEWWGMVVMVT